MVSVSLLRRRAPNDALPADAWQVEYASGPEPAQRPEDAEVQVPAGADLVLAHRPHPGRLGPDHPARLRRAGPRALGARPAGPDRRCGRSARGDRALARCTARRRRARPAHPIAAARAAVDSLRSADVDWSSTERGELLDAAEESLTRLASLVADLLDLSRLRAGVLTVARDSVWLDDLVPPALDELGLSSDAVTWPCRRSSRRRWATRLVTRVVVNLVGNAIRYSPPGQPPLVAASATARRSSCGHRQGSRHTAGGRRAGVHRLPAPWRLAEPDRAGAGAGPVPGLVEAMGGTLVPEETPVAG